MIVVMVVGVVEATSQLLCFMFWLSQLELTNWKKFNFIIVIQVSWNNSLDYHCTCFYNSLFCAEMSS